MGLYKCALDVLLNGLICVFYQSMLDIFITQAICVEWFKSSDKHREKKKKEEKIKKYILEIKAPLEKASCEGLWTS